MKDKILELIDEQKSPLCRIMSVTNGDDPQRRHFDNNISAFHIGNGLILSVSHNLRQESQILKSIAEHEFQNNIINNCNADERALMLKCYLLDNQTGKRYINILDNNDIQPLVDAFKRINYDTRWISLYSNGICKPFLLIQFKKPEFYNDAAVTAQFNPLYKFPEPSLNTNTFLLELELLKAFDAEDIAIYRLINTPNDIIAKIPFAKLNFEIFGTEVKMYCLQGSPSGSTMGRLLNEARVEGLSDYHSFQTDQIAGMFHHEGLRYLLKGYFRFGSSGAPYFIFNEEENEFEVNAIQSEACPIQLSINNSLEGNSQFVNAIATHISLIKDELNNIINDAN